MAPAINYVGGDASRYVEEFTGDLSLSYNVNDPSDATLGPSEWTFLENFATKK